MLSLLRWAAERESQSYREAEGRILLSWPRVSAAVLRGVLPLSFPPSGAAAAGAGALEH